MTNKRIMTGREVCGRCDALAANALLEGQPPDPAEAGPHVEEAPGNAEPPKGVGGPHVLLPMGEPTAKLGCGDPRGSANNEAPWKLALVGPGNGPGAGAPGSDWDRFDG